MSERYWVHSDPNAPEPEQPQRGKKRCNATVVSKRCDFAGTREELREHANDSGHTLCRICSRSLQNHEPNVCGQCVQNTRDALIGIRATDLEPAIEATALHPGELPGGNALVMAADGSIESPQRPDQYTHPIESVATAHLQHPEIAGREQTVTWWRRLACKHDGCTQTTFPHKHTTTTSTTHRAYTEKRQKTIDTSTGLPSKHSREHVKDHWSSDPLLPLATLEGIERIWRSEFGHGPAESVATLENTVNYLLTWLHLAARTWDGFNDDAKLIQQLHTQITHTTGQANDPERAAARCIDCDGLLISPYREPTQPAVSASRLRAIVKQGEAEISYGLTPTPLADALGRRGLEYEGREMIEGDEPEPVWECLNCRMIYNPVEYRLAVAAAIEARAEIAG